jgi:hypothetical protein
MLYRRVAFLLPAAALMLTGCDQPSASSGGAIPANLTIVSGDLQTGVVGNDLPAPLVIRVTDARGKGVAGQVVNFRVTVGSGSVFGGTAITNSDGYAREIWTLGTTARDTQRVQARAVDASTGQPLIFAAFRATAQPDAPASLSKTGGDGQTGAPGVPLTEPLAVRLTDRYGNPIAGQAIGFSPTGGGSVSSTVVATDSAGTARVLWTPGTRLDIPQTITATFGSLPVVTFNATIAPSGILSRFSGDAQQGVVGNRLQDSLAVRLTTPAGSPVEGALIQWNDMSDGSVSPQTTVTNASGIAKTAWRMGVTPGTKQVSATLIGTTQTVAFFANAVADTPSSIMLLGLNPTGSVPRGTQVTVRVTVKDRYSNPVASQSVQWTNICGGPLSPETSTTDTQGQAQTQWTISENCGPAGTHAQATVVGAGTIEFAGPDILPDAATLLVLTPNEQSVLEDQQQAVLTVALYDATGAYISPTACGCYSQIEWQIEDPTILSIFRFEIDTATFGTLRGGTTRVIAKKGALMGTATVNVMSFP